VSTQLTPWWEVLKLRDEIAHSSGSIDDVQMSLFQAVYGTVSNRPAYADAAYYGEITHPSPLFTDLMAKVAEIDKWYVQQLAAFLEKLDKTQDVDGKSLLHNSMIIYGSGIADGNRHSHTSLPIVLAGRGGGTLDAGRFVTNKSSPMCNLYLSLADRMGYKDLQRFGDSTGRLTTV